LSIRETIKAALEADETLAGLLTGGIWTGESEISREGTPGAFDGNGEILPCALVKEESQAAHGPLDDSARLYLVIYLYQRRGYGSIDAARERMFELLQLQKLGMSGVWEIRWADDAPNLQDQALNCNLAMSRFVVTRRR
jgi:hypothetical protein